MFRPLGNSGLRKMSKLRVSRLRGRCMDPYVCSGCLWSLKTGALLRRSSWSLCTRYKRISILHEIYNVILDHKTCHKGQFFEIYTSSKS